MPFPALRELPLSWRVLITAFLLVLGVGYGAAGLNAALSVGLSPAGIAGHYRDQTLTGAEAEIVAEQGFVEEDFSFDDEGVSTAGSAGMEAPDMDHDDMGHDDMAGGRSISLAEMVELAHIHLISFSFILFFVGVLACLTGWPEGVKSALVAVLAACLLMDIGGLFLVRFVNEAFAPLTFAGGAGIGVILLITAVRVLWEMWGQAPART